MDMLFNIHSQKKLLKREDFVDNIGSILVDIFNIPSFVRNFVLSENNMIQRCSICSQLVHTWHDSFIICGECCKECVGKKFMIVISYHMIGIHTGIIKYVCHDSYPYTCMDEYELIDTFPDICKGLTAFYGENKTILITHVVNNSHKLIQRFYNMAPIIFLLSKYDMHSPCSVLNKDIMLFILTFIY